MRSLLRLAAVTSVVLIGGCSNDGGGSTVGSSSTASVKAMSTSEFQLKVNQIQPGTPKNEVIKAIGKPDLKENGVMGVPRPGPQPPATINAGSRYEHWTYLRAGNEYHIFLAGSTVDPGHWVVMSTAANPVGAVAH
jgi:hypothetical protein